MHQLLGVVRDATRPNPPQHFLVIEGFASIIHAPKADRPGGGPPLAFSGLLTGVGGLAEGPKPVGAQGGLPPGDRAPRLPSVGLR